MDNHHENRSKINGETVVMLLDQDEYPSHIGNVAAISDEHIWFLKRDMDELTHFKLAHLDASDCRAIEYKKETACYRILVGVALLITAAVLAFNLIAGYQDLSAESGPVVIVIIAFASIGGALSPAFIAMSFASKCLIRPLPGDLRQSISSQRLSLLCASTRAIAAFFEAISYSMVCPEEKRTTS